MWAFPVDGGEVNLQIQGLRKDVDFWLRQNQTIAVRKEM